MPDAPPPWRRALAGLLPPLLYLGLAVLLFHSTWAAPSSTTVGYRGDSDGTMWFQEWTRYAVGHGVSPFLSDHLNYPDSVNLTWQTAQPLTALAAWPVASLAGPYVAYDVLATLALALSAWLAYLVIRRWVPRRSAAFAGGLLYGFSPYMAAHSLGHLNLATAFVPPLLLACLDEVLVRQRWSIRRAGIVLGVLVLVQVYVTEEMLATEVVMAAVAVVLLALLHGSEVRRRAAYVARALGIAAVIGAVGAAPMLWVQFTGPHKLPSHFQLPGGFSSDLLSFAVPTAIQQVQPHAAAVIADRFNGNIAEQNSYLGIPLLLILAYTIWRFRRIAWVRVVALLGVAAALLSMGPTLHVDGVATHIPLPWVVLEHTPLLGNLLPARVMVYGYLMAGLLLAPFIDHIWRERGGAALVGGALLVLGLIALLPTFDFPASAHSDPRFFTAGGDVQRIAEGASVLVAPWVSSGEALDPEMWQVKSGLRFRMPSGYFNQPDPRRPNTHIIGPAPRPLSDAMIAIFEGKGAPAITAVDRHSFAADLHYWRVSTVVVGPMPNHDAMVAFFTDLLGRPPVEDQGVDAWFQPVEARAASAPTSWSYTYTAKRS